MKSRSFMIILYPEDNSHMLALNYCISHFSDYAYILHDKDNKKFHYHLVLKFPNPRSVSSLANEINIPENYISVSYKSYKMALRYLIHLDDKDKYQYSIDEVHGTLKPLLIKQLIETKSEDSIVLEIIKLLDNIKRPISMKEFAQIVCSHGYWSYFRRANYIFSEILREHNSFY